MSENDSLAPGEERLSANRGMDISDTVRRSKTVYGGGESVTLGLAQSLWPNTLNLADATAGKPGSVSDAASAAFKGNEGNSLDDAMERLGTPLTARELDVVRLVLSGFSNKEVASRLSLSPETVKVHRRNFYTKLNIKSQSELFALCFQRSNINTSQEKIQPNVCRNIPNAHLQTRRSS